MTAIHIDLVEDNADLRDELVFHLKRLNHDVRGHADAHALEAGLRERVPDVLLLDVGLPGESGLSLARRLRPVHPLMGIVMLTARGAVEDRVAGFDHGADIYLVKPVDLRELAVVIESLYRRAHRIVQPERQSYWQLDVQTLELVSPTGRKVVLTPTEFKLMRVLAEFAPNGVPRVRLVETLGFCEHNFDPRRLETAMSRLRKKLEHNGEDTLPLRSVRSVGYAFAASIKIWSA
jgi:DNA-binding response OmpR family regulator